MGDPRIVLLDLEILPNLKKALKYWPKLSSFYGKTLKASVTSICCIGYKILGEKETQCINAWDFPQWELDVNDDKPVLEAFLPIVQSADMIVTHNGKNFDKKYLQTRLIMHELETLDKTAHGDTKQIASSNYFFIDNKLQTLGEELFGERKLDHEGWELWEKTHGRDPEAMRTMEAYCKQDVNLLEKVFRRFRPQIKDIPNHNLLNPYKEKVCPSCGSSRLRSEGRRHTKTKSYRRYICADCRSWSQGDLKDELLRG